MNRGAKDRAFWDPGALNHRLQLIAVGETPDGCGDITRSEDPVADLWANIRPAVANRELLAQQQAETVTHVITLRFRQDVQSGWFFQDGQRRFEVLTVHDPDERQRYLVCNTLEEGR